MSVTMTDGVTDYVQAVRAALADLPAVQREELLDDLSQHLQEVAAETDVPLSVRLGSPAAYADELRASIGLSPDSVGSRSGVLDRMEARLDRGREALLHHPTGRAVVDFLPELRPGWWVLRGYLFVAVPSVLWDYRGAPSLPWPTVSGSRVLGLLATLAAIVASVGLGRHTATTGRWHRPVVVGNTLLVLAALVAFTSGRITEPPNGSYTPAWSVPLTGPDGLPITNIFPYAADGRPLTGVRLYDQNGRPLDNLTDPRDGGPYYERRNPTDAAGNEVTNAYPLVRPPLSLDGTPLTGATTAPPLVNVPPLASPTQQASASPQASSSAQASPSPSPAPVSPSPSPSAAPSTASPPPTP
jgi:hypothetical protein